LRELGLLSIDVLPEHQRSRVRALFRACDADGEGKLDRDEYSRILVPTVGLSSELATAAFKEFDANGSGTLDYFEAVELLQKHASGWLEKGGGPGSG